MVVAIGELSRNRQNQEPRSLKEFLDKQKERIIVFFAKKKANLKNPGQKKEPRNVEQSKEAMKKKGREKGTHQGTKVPHQERSRPEVKRWK